MLMNPPFNVDGDSLGFISHINHAFACLAPGGELVAIAGRHFKTRTETKAEKFRALIRKYGDDEDLPDDAFEHCNIKTKTTLVRLDKPK
jgi:hypothetical protein